jgi:hypothetical protein
MFQFDWKRTLPYVALILVCGGFALSIPHGPNYENADASTYHQATNITLEGLATAIIAVFAIFQYFEFRRSSERQLRAYVMIEHVKFSRPDTEDGDYRPWAVELSLKNYGQTPAYKVSVVVDKQIGVEERDETVRFEMTDGKQTFPESALGPQATITIRLNDGLPNGAATWLEHRSHGHRAYAWGRISYVDTFRKNRWTDFQAVNFFGQIHQFGYCQAGNGTDDFGA